MEPENYPFKKGKYLPNLHFGVPCQISGVYIVKRFFPTKKLTSSAGKLQNSTIFHRKYILQMVDLPLS